MRLGQKTTRQGGELDPPPVEPNRAPHPPKGNDRGGLNAASSVMAPKDNDQGANVLRSTILRPYRLAGEMCAHCHHWPRRYCHLGPLPGTPGAVTRNRCPGAMRSSGAPTWARRSMGPPSSRNNMEHRR